MSPEAVVGIVTGIVGLAAGLGGGLTAGTRRSARQEARAETRVDHLVEEIKRIDEAMRRHAAEDDHRLEEIRDRLDGVLKDIARLYTRAEVSDSRLEGFCERLDGIGAVLGEIRDRLPAKRGA